MIGTPQLNHKVKSQEAVPQRTKAIVQTTPNSPKGHNINERHPGLAKDASIVQKKVALAKSQNPSRKTSPIIGKHVEPVGKKQYKEGKNCVRKFAFATRVGYHPHNPNKQNQD
jgi:hypothetical protein